MNISSELEAALETRLGAKQWCSVYLADYKKIPLLEEYLEALAEGRLGTDAFPTLDTTP